MEQQPISFTVNEKDFDSNDSELSSTLMDALSNDVLEACRWKKP